MQFVAEFFKKIISAKLNSEEVTIDWYKKAFINNKLSSEDIAINAGLNKKTINNMYSSATKSIVIKAANEHFEMLYNSIQSLVEIEKEIKPTFTIKLKNKSVKLSVSESLVVINTLAVKRAQLRGGIWSTAGKSSEKYLMIALCKLYKVDKKYYNADNFVKDKNKKVDREIDFYLINNGKKYLCEVKLMGKGNPESADVILARKSDVLIADTLSQQNKNQIEESNASWVALRDKDGFRRFEIVLNRFKIPYVKYNGNLDKDLPKILEEIV